MQINLLKKKKVLKMDGLTLLEMSYVLALVISMIAITGFAGANHYIAWRSGKEAQATLLATNIAVKQYLADNPTVDLSALTFNLLTPYYTQDLTTRTKSDGSSIIDANGAPHVPDNKGVYVAITLNSNGVPTCPVDFSGKTDDGLWDMGY
jgi:Tfp pilus assembly protein PilE